MCPSARVAYIYKMVSNALGHMMHDYVATLHYVPKCMTSLEVFFEKFVHQIIQYID